MPFVVLLKLDFWVAGQLTNKYLFRKAGTISKMVLFVGGAFEGVFGYYPFRFN